MISPDALSIVLVEDNTDDVLLLQRSLRKTGVSCGVTVCGDGESAVRYLAGEGEYSDRTRFPLPSLLLLDLKLPRKNGFEVLSWMRSQPGLRRLPVVVLTSSREESDLKRAYDLGANSYMVKRTGTEATTDLMRILTQYWLTANEQPPLK